MWRSAVAWQVSLIMATQGLTYFMLVTWLPTIEVASMGVDPVTAGWHSFLYQIVGIAAGLGVTPFMRRRSDHRAVGVVISLLLIVAVLGLLFAPDLLVLWLVVAGLSGGSSLVLALALVGERSPSAADAGRLSGMAQSVGYLLAAAGPLGAGVLFAATGSWTYPLVRRDRRRRRPARPVAPGRPRPAHPSGRARCRLDQGVKHLGDQRWLAPRGHSHRTEVSYAELGEADEAQSRSLLDG